MSEATFPINTFAQTADTETRFLKVADNNLLPKQMRQKRSFLSPFVGSAKSLENLVTQTLSKTQFDLSRYWPPLENRTFVAVAASVAMGSQRPFSANYPNGRFSDETGQFYFSAKAHFASVFGPWSVQMERLHRYNQPC